MCFLFREAPYIFVYDHTIFFYYSYFVIVPNEKKSELFINSGIFPFIAMGVLSALFITMMIAALYFARNSADAQHAQLIG